MQRALRLAQVEGLREEGMVAREIAEELGLARSTVQAYIHDPSGAKDRARKRRYAGTCERCGGPTCGNNGRAKAPRHCVTCAPIVHRKWDADSIVEAIRAFARRYGVPPSATDWNPALARSVGHPEVAERYYRDGCWPSATTVQYVFGSWAAGLHEAGYTPRAPGRPRRKQAVAA